MLIIVVKGMDFLKFLQFYLEMEKSGIIYM